MRSTIGSKKEEGRRGGDNLLVASASLVVLPTALATALPRHATHTKLKFNQETYSVAGNA